MNADLEIVRLCNAIYDPSYIDWDKLWTATERDGIYAGIKNNTLIFRGSVSLEDWFRDFIALPHYGFDHPQLGLVHQGFNEGMDEFFEEASKFLGPNPLIGGHSLGAARAWLFAGRCVVQGNIPARVSVYGSPKPGCWQLRQLMAPVSKISGCNGVDPVPYAPPWMPDLPVVPPCADTDFHVAPPVPANVFSWHHPQFYEQGVEAMYASSAAAA